MINTGIKIVNLIGYIKIIYNYFYLTGKTKEKRERITKLQLIKSNPLPPSSYFI